MKLHKYGSVLDKFELTMGEILECQQAINAFRRAGYVTIGEVFEALSNVECGVSGCFEGSHWGGYGYPFYYENQNIDKMLKRRKKWFRRGQRVKGMPEYSFAIIGAIIGKEDIATMDVVFVELSNHAYIEFVF